MASQLLSSERLSKPCAIGITSSLNNEGKTTVSIALASALALENRKQSVLVEADMDNPSIADDFGLDPAHGISNYLAGMSPANSVVQPTQTPNLFAIAANKYPDATKNNTSLLRKRFPELLAALKNQFFFTIVDLPPVSDANTKALVECLDGVLLVVRANVTPIEKLKAAAREMEGPKLMGVIQVGPEVRVPRWFTSLTSE